MEGRRDDEDYELLVRQRFEEMQHQQQKLTRVASEIARAQQFNYRLKITGQKRGWVRRVSGTKNVLRETSSCMADYFGKTSIYPMRLLRRPSSVPRALFHKIVADLLQYNYEFGSTRREAAKRQGIPTEIKVMDALL